MLPKKSTRIRKEEIVQAAIQVIGAQGVNSLTIAAIAGRAGMSEANIYRHFGGKQEILSALADFIGTEVMGKAAAIAGGSGPPLEKLRTIFFSHVSLIAELPGIPRFIFSDEVHLGDRDLSRIIAQRMAGYVETISGIISAGIAEGEIKASLAPRETALTMLGMIQFTALRWTVAGTSFDIREEAGKLWDNFMHLTH